MQLHGPEIDLQWVYIAFRDNKCGADFRFITLHKIEKTLLILLPSLVSKLGGVSFVN